MHVEQDLRLDAGEIEAIALASELGDATLLIDERNAAKLAAQRGLPVIGTLAVLAEAAANDILDLAVTMEKLLNTNFRCPAPLIAELLRRDAERRRRS
jgi:predicted nucleic acid-binding protein